jgi:hypothetical protein
LTVGVDYRTSPCKERVQPVELSRRVGADFVQADSATIAGLQEARLDAGSILAAATKTLWLASSWIAPARAARGAKCEQKVCL